MRDIKGTMTKVLLPNIVHAYRHAVPGKAHLEVLHHGVPLLLGLGPLVLVHGAVVDPHKALSTNICQDLWKSTNSYECTTSLEMPGEMMATSLL